MVVKGNTMKVEQHHIDEAKRRLESVCFATHMERARAIHIIAEALASDRWEPPVNPDLLLARELAAEMHPNLTWDTTTEKCSYAVKVILAGIRAADKRAGRVS